MSQTHLDIHSGPSYGTLDNMQDRNDEEDQLLRDGYLSEGRHDDDDDDDDDVDSESEVQEGVRKIEAINLTWTTRTLIIAYIRLVWMELWVKGKTGILTFSGPVYFLWRFARRWRVRLSCP